jgi:hypothetical protein
MNKLLETLYEPHVRDARNRLETHPRVRALLELSVDPALLERFLMQFCSLGVRMTEPVDGWIRRAGERCISLGLEEVGRALVSHAKHEAGHHTMMIEDTRHLVRRWNARRTPQLDADALLAQPPPPFVQAYVRLHEDVIAGALPAGQVAIELEIESLSLRLGPRVIQQCQQVLGKDIVEGLSFVTEHVALDGGHTELNAWMMEKLLGAIPQHAQALGRIGAEALDIYYGFLGDCLDTARAALAAEAGEPAKRQATA